jgi:hypothetical protein
LLEFIGMCNTCSLRPEHSREYRKNRYVQCRVQAVADSQLNGDTGELASEAYEVKVAAETRYKSAFRGTLHMTQVYHHRMDQDRAAAAHVAGHGVVGEIMGFECLGLTIRWTDQHLGVCRWPAIPETVFQQLQFQSYGPADRQFGEIENWVTRRIKSYLAGALAEERVTGSYNLAWATTDLNMISVIIRNVFGLQGPHLDERLTSEIYYDVDLGMEIEDLTRVVLRARERWDDEVKAQLITNLGWVDEVTELVLEHNTISGDQMRAVRHYD